MATEVHSPVVDQWHDRRVPDTIGLLARALEQMTSVLERLPPDSLNAPTPCDGWAVRELLRHVVRQNLRNFTTSARGETVDWSAPPPELGGEWWLCGCGAELQREYGLQRVDLWVYVG